MVNGYFPASSKRALDDEGDGFAAFVGAFAVYHATGYAYFDVVIVGDVEVATEFELDSPVALGDVEYFRHGR